MSKFSSISWYMVYVYLSKQFSWLKVSLNLSFYCKSSLGKTKSKETDGQTRGLSNLEMKYVGGLAIIGVLLNAVKTSRVCTMLGHTYLTKCSAAGVSHLGISDHSFVYANL